MEGVIDKVASLHLTTPNSSVTRTLPFLLDPIFWGLCRGAHCLWGQCPRKPCRRCGCAVCSAPWGAAKPELPTALTLVE